MAMGKKPRYQEVDGIRLPLSFVPEVFRSAMAYKPRKDEVVITSYPKCGTTWIMQIALLIMRKGRPCSNADEYFASNPFLESIGEEGMKHTLKPTCIKTHLPCNRINFSQDAKYIYVARHPADCVVSFYHHTKFFPIYFFSDGSFDDFFELFINGMVDFNDYFDHLLSWYSKKDRPNVLFLTFEDVKADTKGAVLQIAHFLGGDYYECLIADEEKVLTDVLHGSSLEFMRSTVNKYWREVFIDKPISEDLQSQSPEAKKYAQLLKEAEGQGHRSVGEFIRKGNTGDGMIILSKDQIQKMNEYIIKKTKDIPNIMSLWP